MGLGVVGAGAGASLAPTMLLGTGLGLADAIGQYMGQKETNKVNSQIAAETNAANERIAQKQMDFQANMSNTAYQRAMSDMKAAGLNPMLAYQQGGASTPAGAGIAAVSRSFESPIGKTAKAGISTAMDAARLGSEMQSRQVQNSLATAQTQTQISQRELNTASARAADANAKRSNAEAAIATSRIRSEAAKARVEEKNAKIDERNVEFDNWNRRINHGLGTIGSAKDIFMPKATIQWKQGSDRVPPGMKRGDMVVDKKGEVLYEH